MPVEISDRRTPGAIILPPPDAAVPPLETGDRLTRREFERRYDATSGLKKAELIAGRVYIPLPVRFRSHGQPHGQMVGWLGTYATFTPGVECSDSATVRLDEENEPQPDAMLFIEGPPGGSASISDDDYVEGAPELIVEVAGSSAAYDLHEKLDTYRRHGVREYVVWQVWDGRIDWFRLEAERYLPQPHDADGVIRSRVFPGLWLDVAAMLKGEMGRVLAVLQQGLSSPDHEAFVQRLSQENRQA
jgi:Uma2 family endonuclease